MKNTDSVISFINKTPKSELHLHIEGSLEPELMFKLSKRNKIEIPFKSVDEIRSAYNFTNLDKFYLKTTVNNIKSCIKQSIKNTICNKDLCAILFRFIAMISAVIVLSYLSDL